MNPHTNERESARILEPNERISEILFGLIMVLTFTGSLSVAEAGRAEVSTMLFGALGCNLAWGVIDAIMYLMACLNQRGRSERLLAALHDSADAGRGCEVVRAALPEAVEAVLQPAELESLRQQLLRLPRPQRRPRLQGKDWMGALGVLFLVFLSAVPVVVPFALLSDLTRALRISNAIAIVLLFAAGWLYGRSTGIHPLITGLIMVLLGGALVGITIALGG